MKNLVDKLQKNRLIFTKLTPINIKKEFNSRKKIDLYLGVDLKNYYACIIHINKKSTILQKEAFELMEFHKKLEQYNDSAIKKRYIYIQAPLSSKAKILFQKKEWRILM